VIKESFKVKVAHVCKLHGGMEAELRVFSIYNIYFLIGLKMFCEQHIFSAVKGGHGPVPVKVKLSL
jgi:hypothetical protein